GTPLPQNSRRTGSGTTEGPTGVNSNCPCAVSHAGLVIACASSTISKGIESSPWRSRAWVTTGFRGARDGAWQPGGQSDMAKPIRIGAVSYLNARPLYHDLERYAPGVELSIDLPIRLAEQLAAGALEVALIPSVEYLRGAGLGYEIIPDLAIASRGPVRSVKLFSRVPWARVERLALDEGSRTSQVLARIWL